MEQNIPAWNLSDLYTGINDQRILEDQSNLVARTEQFVTLYKGKIDNSITAEVLFNSIQEFEAINMLLGKLSSFSYLTYSTDVRNPENSQFLQKINDFSQNISQQLVFFSLSLNTIDDDIIAALLKESTRLQEYSSFIEQTRKFKPYQLPEIAEQVLIAKQSVARSSWVKLYDKTLASIQFNDPIEAGSQNNLSTMLNLQLSPDAKVRQQAASNLKEGLSTQEDLIVTIINNILKDYSVNNQFRGMPKPYSIMNLHNLIEDNVMENLVNVVTDSFKNISARYYTLKAKLLNMQQMNYWDRNAPLFNFSRKFTFAEAQEIVLKAFNEFSTEFAEIGALFFKNNWIDARLQPNKMSGAFAHPTTVDVHPYIMLNFYGEYTDVTTLAHELGHGIHQYLARQVGELQADTPLVLAETASIFGEQLVFDYLRNTITDTNTQKYLLSNKIEGIINSVHRQIAFHNFELQLHQLRGTQELTAEQIKQIFIATQKDCLGESITLALEDGIFWSYVSHFFHAPFYVYAYAFGDCLVRSLYATYQNGDANFINKYLELLAAGGKITPKVAIQRFGFDISKPDFWQNGLNITARLIDELESIL